MDRARFESEALPHFKALYGTAHRMTRNPHDAEDLVQETLLRAYRAFDTYTEGTNVRAWLFTILHRVRTDGFRRAGRKPREVEMNDDGPPVRGAQEAVAAELDVSRALDALPEVFRTAVTLRDIQDFSYDEIAKILSVPVGTVMSRIHRGRTLLRQALAAGEAR